MQFIDHIIKGFSQPLSHEEKAQIESWKNESENNLKALNELKKLNQVASDLKGYQPFDINAAWQKLEQKSQADMSESATSPLKIYKLIASLAAVLVLGVAVYLLVFNQSESVSSTPTYTTTHLIEEIQLVDGTQVTLDKNSNLQVVSDRSVELLGRAYFSVSSTPDKAKFEIDIAGGKVTVMGTKFTVLNEHDMLEVSVDEGHVVLSQDSRKVDVFANQIARVIDGDIIVNTDSYLNTGSWSTNELVFESDSINRILSDLSNYFRVPFVAAKNINNLEECTITTKFVNPTIESVIKELKTIFNAEIIKQGNSYVLIAIQC